MRGNQNELMSAWKSPWYHVDTPLWGDIDTLSWVSTALSPVRANGGNIVAQRLPALLGKEVMFNITFSYNKNLKIVNFKVKKILCPPITFISEYFPLSASPRINSTCRRKNRRNWFLFICWFGFSASNLKKSFPWVNLSLEQKGQLNSSVESLVNTII